MIAIASTIDAGTTAVLLAESCCECRAIVSVGLCSLAAWSVDQSLDRTCAMVRGFYRLQRLLMIWRESSLTRMRSMTEKVGGGANFGWLRLLTSEIRNRIRSSGTRCDTFARFSVLRMGCGSVRFIH